MKTKATAERSRDTTVRSSSLTPISAVLASLGVDPAPVFAKARFDPALFDRPDNQVPLIAVGRLVAQCVATTECPHFGLLVGQQGGSKALGLIGLMARHSPDVETALRRLGTYLHLNFGGQVLPLTVRGDLAYLSYTVYQTGVQAVDQIEDGALAIFYNTLRDLCGSNWLPAEVHFAHRRPQNLRPFVQFFRTSLQFDADQSALVFSANWLRRRLPEIDVDLQRLLKNEIEALEDSYGEEFPEQVRSVLRTALLSGHASADNVAALFSMHRRTLTRRLAAYGTSFSDLVEEGRLDIARRMLQDTTLDVSHIAATLDYADASAFTRAFRRWTGTTPAAWRAHRGSNRLVAGRRVKRPI